MALLTAGMLDKEPLNPALLPENSEVWGVGVASEDCPGLAGGNDMGNALSLLPLLASLLHDFH